MHGIPLGLITWPKIGSALCQSTDVYKMKGSQKKFLTLQTSMKTEYLEKGKTQLLI